ncbi:helix-turn-helix domain-containing protein [Paenibacillus sp. P96]|uniref:Helix-turn-helix domain-containing protein n=1 Tax=Paenibacillus zeirhizosphaerae TaxID=2987519 RepID=A0ABT9FL35_9BACL|nr:helix-turn-helix domain-containing protein [Paenibacillus sp. P96]MDP4095444.1 helix-turn-helix domain-containing protein [Paenibacillus sp. P96]
MTTADLITSLRSDIKNELLQEILSELQPAIQQQLYANIFDFAEACNYLKVSQSTLRRMLRTTNIPHYKQRGKIYFRQISLDKWAQEQEVITKNEKSS